MNKVFKVCELNSYIKRILSEDVFLSNISVSGEISNFTHHSSGHMYFSLKDSDSKIKCVMFKAYNQDLDIDLKDGVDVLVKGSIGVFEKTGQYQLYIKDIELAGIGDLYLKFEKLKASLSEAGLFDQEFKKKIPKYPKRIGVITSATGAAVRDIENVIYRRYPVAKTYIYPTLVQGEEASENIKKALLIMDNYGLDTIILARGGGAMEDLSAFNDEELAHIIFALKTPIITGIGHEIDFTIADFVADLRAPTPSAAAEVATPDLLKLKDDLDRKIERISELTEDRLLKEGDRLGLLLKSINYNSPVKKINEYYQSLDYLFNELLNNRRLEDERHGLNLMKEKLESFNLEENLSRGYSIVSKAGSLIRTVEDINEDEVYNLKLKDGSLDFKFKILKED